jgi:hypothetical protein
MARQLCNVSGTNPEALFTLKIHRGESMVLLAMNWREDTPPDDFVGFAIEYKEPGGEQFFALKNRLSFAGEDRSAQALSTRLSPIQKFRWVHFPRNAELAGEFTYRVTPVFMDGEGQLSYHQAQEASIELGLETLDGELNVAFTRGFVSSQAFSDKFLANGHHIAELMPGKAKWGLDFEPSHPETKRALDWMGFEARNAVLAVLDQALADSAAQVSVIAYDLNEPEVLQRLMALKRRVRVIIDNSGEHGHADSAETKAENMLMATAGAGNVLRQNMGGLQHNKTIVVNGPVCQAVVCGSTNFSWRGFYIQANNAVVLRGAQPVQVFLEAFDTYWSPGQDDPDRVRQSNSAGWTALDMPSVQAQVTFSPHSKENAVLAGIADDIRRNTRSNVFFALAFLYQTQGAMRDAITALVDQQDVFVYGMSDQETGIDLRMANGHMAIVQPAILAEGVPEPFSAEIAGGNGIRLHHKFIVTDFDQPHARVYMGSFNFSQAADLKNGENLLVIENQRVATAYMVEAVRLFDHYEYRVRHEQAQAQGRQLQLAKPPRSAGERPWWYEHWTDPLKIKDRQLFS